MTAQDPDRIRYQRRVYDLSSEPLEDYFNEHRPKPESFAGICSACWRGYMARWSIRKGKLYLDRIQPYLDGDAREDESQDDTYHRHMAEIFPNTPSPIFADWFTGELILVSGKIIEYVHLPYATAYENEIVIQIHRGNLVGQPVTTTRTVDAQSANDTGIPHFLRSQS
jgi:hypothetical protein